jgi:hypothetical protein
MIPRTIKLKEIENEVNRKFQKKQLNPEYHGRIMMPKYLCDQCEKNYWTRRVLVQRAMFDQAAFKVCDSCFVILQEICRAQGYRIHVLVMRRTSDNEKELEKRRAAL